MALQSWVYSASMGHIAVCLLNTNCRWQLLFIIVVLLLIPINLCWILYQFHVLHYMATVASQHILLLLLASSILFSLSVCWNDIIALLVDNLFALVVVLQTTLSQPFLIGVLLPQVPIVAFLSVIHLLIQKESPRVALSPSPPSGTDVGSASFSSSATVILLL